MLPLNAGYIQIAPATDVGTTSSEETVTKAGRLFLYSGDVSLSAEK